MKRFVLLIGLMLVGGLVTAQEMSAEANGQYEVAYYDGDPALGGEVISSEEVSANSGSNRNEDLEDTEYVTISDGAQSYTFEVAAAGASRNAVVLELPGQNLSVAEVLAKQRLDSSALERYSNELSSS